MCGIRSAKYQVFYLIGLPLSLMLAGLIGVTVAWNWRDRSDGTKLDAIDPVADTPEPAELPALRKRVAELEQSLANANSHIEQLESGNDALWNEAVRLLNSIPQPDETTEATDRHRAAEDIGRRLASRQRISGGTLGSIDNYVIALQALATLGREGAESMCSAVQDPRASLENRKQAAELLMYIPDPCAVNLLLDLPEEVVPTTDFRPENHTGELARLVELMSNQDSLRCADRLFALCSKAINESPDSDEAWRLAATLGFTKNYISARALFDIGQYKFTHAKAMLDGARWTATDSARQWIEEVSRTHPDPGIRKHAEGLLATW